MPTIIAESAKAGPFIKHLLVKHPVSSTGASQPAFMVLGGGNSHHRRELHIIQCKKELCVIQQCVRVVCMVDGGTSWNVLSHRDILKWAWPDTGQEA